MEYTPEFCLHTNEVILALDAFTNFKLNSRSKTSQTKQTHFIVNFIQNQLSESSSPTGLSGDMGSAPECRPALRGLALSRAEDLRAELLRAEHLKAEAMWEENSDGPRQAKITTLSSF